MTQYLSVEEILGLYHDKDVIEVIEIMMEKEVLRSIDVHLLENGLVQASNAGYISGIMWVRGELAKVKEALNK